VLMPDFRMHLLFIGSISLKWIAIATIVLVLIGVTGNNAGGEIAHIGGVAVGLLYGLRMKRGHDITRPFNRAFDSLANIFRGGFSRGTRRSWTSKTGQTSQTSQTRRTGQTGRTSQPNQGSPSPNCSRDDREALDAILDKIKKSGYSALTPQERQRLFDVSRKIK
ncbi:MAG: rhomboid family intramembrane serine protease, partial [Duncaniella sp.]|nr:rhomboid family intramembrane serine protease [Duncaniella sp.]